jgi:Icc-related predicted phosphoesterase
LTKKNNRGKEIDMKFQLVSDIHLEFGHTVHIPNDGADVLVLAGDICLTKAFKNPDRNINNLGYYHFFDEVCKNFRSVVYVLGNHEHYKGSFNDSAKLLKAALADYDNLHILDNESVFLDGVKFVGATLWTDMNKNCPLTMNHLQFSMNDFNIVKYRDNKDNYMKFSPYQAYREHQVSRLFLESETNEPCVVVTHHAPSFKSIAPIYQNDTYTNGGYASDLEHMMNDNIKVWCHGHTHTPFDYTVNKTRVICNPLGYPGERKLIDPVVIVEV